MTLDDQVDRPVEQRMTWCHVLSQRSALGRDEIFLERHTLVLAQHGSTRADLTVTAAQFGRDLADLEPAWLAFPDDPSDVGEGLVWPMRWQGGARIPRLRRGCPPRPLEPLGAGPRCRP